jgi:hypothetical protein
MASSGTIRIVKQIRREGRNEMEIKEEVVRVLVTRTAVVAIDYLLHMTLRLIENATITIAWEPRYTNSSSSNRLSSPHDTTIDRERYHNDRLGTSATTTTTSSSYSVRGEMSTSTEQQLRYIPNSWR